MKRWFFALCVLTAGCGPVAVTGESWPEPAPEQAPSFQWPPPAVTEIAAPDSEAAALERWLCEFFSAPQAQRPDLLARAPLPFPPGANQAQQEFWNTGGFGDPSRDIPPRERHQWSIGLRDQGGRMIYDHTIWRTLPERRYGFELRIDTPDRPRDEAAVLTFLRHFGAPAYEPATDVYTIEITDTERDEGGGFQQFRIAVVAQSGLISIVWMHEQQARFGRRFCPEA